MTRNLLTAVAAKSDHSFGNDLLAQRKQFRELRLNLRGSFCIQYFITYRYAG